MRYYCFNTISGCILSEFFSRFLGYLVIQQFVDIRYYVHIVNYIPRVNFCVFSASTTFDQQTALPEIGYSN